MKVIAVIFAAVILSAVEANVEPETIESRNVESAEVENNTKKTDAFEESQLIYIQSIIFQLHEEAKYEDKDDSPDLDSLNTKADELKEEDHDEKKEIYKTGTTDTSDSSVSSESDSEEELSKEVGRSVSNSNNTRKNSILDYLTKVLNDNKVGEATETSRRLDIEDNGDEFSDVVDIDNPSLNDYNQEVVNFKANRAFSSYGARLDMKGRSGFSGGTGTGSPTNLNKDRSPFNSAMSKNGVFIKHGFYHFATTAPSITFNKIDNRDILQAMSRLNSFPFRRVQNQGIPPQEVILDDNAYRYEPEKTRFETQIKPWK